MIRKIIETTRGYRKRIFLMTILGMLYVASSLGFVWCSKEVIDIATGNSDNNFVVFASVMALILLFQNIFQNSNNWISVRLNSELGNSLRYKFFNYLLKSRWNETEKYKSGDLITRLGSDVSEFVSLLIYILPQLIITTLELCAAFVFLYFLDKTLAVSVILITPVFFLLSKTYVKKMRIFSHDIKSSSGKINSIINESFKHRNILKSFEFIPFQLKSFSRLQDVQYAQISKRAKYSVFSNLVLGLGFGCGYLIAFVWGASQIKAGLITYGTMTAFLQLANRIQTPAYDMLKMVPALISSKTSVERLEELEVLSKEKDGESLFLGEKLSLSLENVYFNYDENTKVFDNISMDFTPGSFNAVIGETGAGKTTMIRLLLGLVKPDGGMISLKDQNQRLEVSEQTRKNFIYVPQGNTLFGMSIRENLLIGNPDSTEEDLKKVLNIAVADFVYDLPEGIDTQLGENGLGVSEGQAQRIAIARALLRPGSILLLDEATSALDIDTETKFIARLKNEMSDKTVIFITHHKSIADICDNVYKI